MAGLNSHVHNHCVPRFMIEYWETLNAGQRGVLVYSLAEDRSHFNKRTRKRPYPFAIVDDLYVPLIAGRRAVSMEARWLNNQETALSRLVRLAHKRSDHVVRDTAEYTRISMALFALEQRSRFNLERLRQLIEGRPDLREDISASPEREPRRLVLENLIHLVTEMHARHWPLEFTFLHSGAKSFLLTDRPGINDRRMTERVMVLTNKVAVVYRQSAGQPTFGHVDAAPEFVDQTNRMLAVKARDWIVADDPTLLDQSAQLTRSAEANAYRRSERAGLIEPLLLPSGSSISPAP